MPASLTLMLRTPGDGATNVCPDTPLRMVLDGTPRLGTHGTVAIWTRGDELVDAIDLADPESCRGTVGGAESARWCDPAFVPGGWVRLPAT
ncbi:hypothetical protein ABN034_25095 [Actinopolymorpha sp. B11F2]|uniref:hypothetical protein n=1 Tax=Actinopolymorpha sp. B11F2 TaxID=3160862 RepID=UPI0032E460A6